jgi:hypothetical protein
VTQSRPEAQLCAAVNVWARLEACMRWSHTTFGYEAYGINLDGGYQGARRLGLYGGRREVAAGSRV